MAKKQKVNKSQTVRNYLKANPKATPLEVVAALKKQGIKMTAGHVSNIKTALNKARTAKKAAKKQVAAPVAVEKPVKVADSFTLDQIKAVVQTVKAVGGPARIDELFALVKEVGGVKKFKDLLEAMSVPETDAIPF